MSALSDADIIKSIAEGLVSIEPFNAPQLCTSSYDVRLGEWYYREQHPQLGPNGDLFNIYDPEHVDRVWGEPHRARSAVVELGADAVPATGLNMTDRVIVLGPGETILAHTEEFIGGRQSVTTMMKARSSLGRCFILVCKCAGWGDVGYINRWTMEITNVSKHFRIPLVVGSRIAQIVFFSTGEIEGADYSASGAYQTKADLAALQAEWSPVQMLPRVRR